MGQGSSALAAGHGGSGEPIPPRFERAAILAHPHFPDAVRAFADGMVALHSRSRVLGWFLSDRILAMLAHAAIALDADLDEDDPRSGLTPGRFKAFCVQAGLCSEGRATAILAFMRLSGQLEAAGHPADRRITRLRPSAKLLESMRSRLRAHIAAASMVCPDIAPAAAQLGDPKFERPLSLEFLRRYREGPRLIDEAPDLRLFAERDVGVLILFALMLGAGPADPLPPAGPMPFSINALSRRFHVSRTHVLRRVRDAEASGLLTRHGERGEQVSFTPRLREGLRRLIASLFQLASLCVWAAMRDAADDSA